MRPSDVTVYRLTDTYVGIDAMHRNRPKTAEHYRTTETVSGVELAGRWWWWLAFLHRSEITELHRYFAEFVLANSSSDFTWSSEVSRF
jgi:hypothetical protein